ncbi:phage distal tail protein [Saccharothrix australiensis]|uniref:Tail protein n=1 Tax=Saccharothrix australiensis TaxID=2072 RepID=A0A495VJA2_9PSEU|nr:phage tail domain-containing protein [Saccharothrix australiensis]RKT49364.1 tail protein [Saccharothrix australiensis]
MPEVVEWIDPDGLVTALDCDWDVTGRGLPPPRLDETGLPQQPGRLLRAVSDDVRDHTWTLWLTGTSEADLWIRQRALLTAMDPERGDGLLRVTTPVGDQRELVCRAIDGLHLVERLGSTSGPEVQQYTVTFRSHRPYWRDVADTTAGPWTPGSDPGGFFPFFPIRLVSSEVFADVSIDNVGDVPSWPVWTITGPGHGLTLRNLTTGRVLSLPSAALAAGQTLTIDTRPRRKSIRVGTANWFGEITTTSSLWSLAKGINVIRVELGAAAVDSSSVSLAYRREYKVV